MDSTTIFDRILAKEIPAKIVYEDEHILAFHDVMPQAPTHVLVIPKRKMKSFADFRQAETETVGRLFQGAAQVAHQLGLEHGGYRVVVNSGKDAQQSVDYVHLHILGGRPMKWPPG